MLAYLLQRDVENDDDLCDIADVDIMMRVDRK